MRRFDIEELPIKTTFIVLFLLEITSIAYKYSANFSDYITWVILLVSIPLCFFLAHYLKAIFGMAKAQLKYSKQVYKKIDGSNQTEEEVRKLMESKQFKDYQKKKMEKIKEGRKSSVLLNAKQIQESIEEFEEKESEIFA